MLFEVIETEHRNAQHLELHFVLLKFQRLSKLFVHCNVSFYSTSKQNMNELFS